MPWLSWLLVLLAVNAMAADPLLEAQARFHALDGYRVTLRSASADGERQIIRYAWRKPGWIRMDFVQPHNGTVMILDPTARRVQLWPFGTQHLPTFNLAPDNPLIRGPCGHQVDHSDAGALLANLTALRERGSMAAPAETMIAGRPATTLEITGGRRHPRYRGAPLSGVAGPGHPVPPEGAKL
ncbi:MAG: hypothetical protein RBS40_16185 [Rhodocyclaceae bacterium]|jgi:hypothetical protein|nr:hypothetical protein [Rhodocyclaceae bacterium]